MNNVPQQEGLYWAGWETAWVEPQTKPPVEYTMIVKVTGKSPFLKARAFYFYLNDMGVISEDKISQVVWGPRISIPHREA